MATTRSGARDAVLVILDTASGERAAALDIRIIEVSDLPDSPERDGYMELDKLADFIAWRKRKLSND